MWKKLLMAVAVAVAFAASGVSGETHHVAGGASGWGPDFNVTAWLLGRRFTVGDKLRFECDEGGIVEVRDAHEFLTCDISNPIRMLTDPVSHVALEEEGVRYFTSGNPDACRNGLKLPVSVHHHDEHEYIHHPPHGPYDPDVPSPPHYDPDVPSPPHEPPYKPDVPPPPHEPYPYPSAATRVDGLFFVLAAAVIIACGLTI